MSIARRPEPATLLYNGSLTYGPNKDAVRWFVGEILPSIQAVRPDVRSLVVTGTVPDDCRDLASVSGVCLTGYLSSLDEILSAATVCVVPLRAGGGTRLKILEAWAARVPSRQYVGRSRGPPWSRRREALALLPTTKKNVC